MLPLQFYFIFIGIHLSTHRRTDFFFASIQNWGLKKQNKNPFTYLHKYSVMFLSESHNNTFLKWRNYFTGSVRASRRRRTFKQNSGDDKYGWSCVGAEGNYRLTSLTFSPSSVPDLCVANFDQFCQSGLLLQCQQNGQNRKSSTEPLQYVENNNNKFLFYSLSFLFLCPVFCEPCAAQRP